MITTNYHIRLHSVDSFAYAKIFALKVDLCGSSLAGVQQRFTMKDRIGV